MTTPTQAELWNGRAGGKWVALQARLDAMLAPVTDALAARVSPVEGKRILDIGCGTGVTCARWLDGGASVTGVDISEPMLAAARTRVQGRADFVCADAATWRGEAPFHLAVSQFGVMFFENPDAAFENIAANLTPAGRLVFACWRPPAENPWVTVPFESVRDLVPDAPFIRPNAPGPFGLADPARTRGILERAGLTQIAIEPVDFRYVLAAEGGVGDAVDFLLQIGPTATALAEKDEALRTEAARRIAAALTPFAGGGAVVMEGAIWLVDAARPG